jgi:hypothetical protein
MITGRLRPVIKLVLGFGFDFRNENQITCHYKEIAIYPRTVLVTVILP